jgi:hypothetical protein
MLHNLSKIWPDVSFFSASSGHKGGYLYHYLGIAQSFCASLMVRKQDGTIKQGKVFINLGLHSLSRIRPYVMDVGSSGRILLRGFTSPSTSLSAS